MWRMDNQWQRALADVVRAELALRGKSAKDAYTALGISSTAWQTYFKSQSRDIPSRVLIDIAAYLRMPLSALIAKAEAREVELAAGAFLAGWEAAKEPEPKEPRHLSAV